MKACGEKCWEPTTKAPKGLCLLVILAESESTADGLTPDWSPILPSNPQILLDNRPTAEATLGNFKLVTLETPPLQDGQVLVRHHFLSLDPYMRGRMNDAKNYTAPQPLGRVMGGRTVGEVVESSSSLFSPGELVVGMGGGRPTASSMWLYRGRCARSTPAMYRCPIT